MNRRLLSVLGCSSSVAIMLLTNSSAQANSVQEYVFTAPDSNEEVEQESATEYPFYDCSCTEYDPAQIERIDREGDKAIALYGCDCAGCRNLVRNLDQSENVPPSQS